MARGYGGFSISYSNMKRDEERAKKYIYSMDEESFIACYANKIDGKPKNDYEKFARQRFADMNKTDKEKLRETDIELYFDKYPEEKAKVFKWYAKAFGILGVIILITEILNSIS